MQHEIEISISVHRSDALNSCSFEEDKIHFYTSKWNVVDMQVDGKIYSIDKTVFAELVKFMDIAMKEE